MSLPGQCHRCGAALDASAAAGVCAPCLQELGQANWIELDPVSAADGAFADYEIIEEIGRGGMGVVYRARQISLDRWVALKIIQAGRRPAEQAERRFQIEAQAAAKLDHPNIVSIYESGQAQGSYFYSMKLIRGCSLADALALPEAASFLDEGGRRFGTKWNEWAALLITRIARAIHYAHQRGVLHRDLKPGNILLDETGSPHVADFGLAKLLDAESSLTVGEAVIGSPAYMAPEQATGRGKESTIAADVYSLGAIFYELLTGQPPFRGTHVADTLRLVAETDPKRPTAIRPRLDSDLETICLKCLEKKPQHRYGSAQDLAEDLERWQRREPIMARPATVFTRAHKWMRRKPAMAALVVALHVVAAAGAAAVLWQWREARDSATRELRQRRVAEANAYAADMNLVQQALAMNNLGRARELLDRHRPPPGSEIGRSGGGEDWRGWEWRYLWRQCQSDASFALCRKTRINSLAISQDGKWLAIGEWDNGGLSIWDLSTRREVLALPAGDERVGVVFSPREPLLAFRYTAGSRSANPRYGVRLWDLSTRRITADWPLGGEGRGLTFSRDGRTLAATSLEPGNRLTLWHVPEAKQVASFPAFPSFFVTGNPLVLTHDLSLAIYGALDGWIVAIDLITGQERWKRKAAMETVATLTLSPDGRTLASGPSGAESAIRLWDVALGEEIARLEGHRAWVGGIAFWPEGNRLASASADQTLRVWDLSDLRNVPPPRALLGHALEVWSLTLLPDSSTLVSGSKDGEVLVWNSSINRRTLGATTLPASVIAWQFAPDSQSLVTLSPDGRVVRWRGADFTEARGLINIGTNHWGGRFSPGARWLATGSTDGVVRLWNLEDATAPRRCAIAKGRVIPWTFSAEATVLLVADDVENVILELDVETGARRRSWPCPVRVNDVLLSEDGRWCLMLSYHGQGVLRNMATGDEVAVDGIPTPGEAAFALDGSAFAVADDSGFAKLWATAPLRELATVRGFLLGVHSVGFTTDGSRLVIGSSGEEAIRLWDLRSRRALLTLPGQNSRFWRPSFSPDGNVLGSVNGIGVLHLWRAPSWEEIAAAAPWHH